MKKEVFSIIIGKRFEPVGNGDFTFESRKSTDGYTRVSLLYA